MGHYQRYRIVFWATLFAFAPLLLSGQVNLNLYTDLGANSASQGLYFKSGAMASYEFGKNRIGIGLQNYLGPTNDNFFTAYRGSCSRKITISGKTLEPNAFFIYRPYSGTLFERNLGVLVDWRSSHIENSLGIDFRRYGYTNRSADSFGVDADDQIIDNWRIIYRLGINIKPLENRWNIAFILSNIDNFVVNNTELPAITVRGQYMVVPETTLFVESWFKSTGLGSISFNPYGLFLRTGISWKL